MTLYVVQAPGTDPAALEKARVVRDGFSWPAFLFGWLWLLYHRCWLALLAWLVVEAVVIIVSTTVLTPGAAIMIDLLARLYLGLEGNYFRLKRDAAVTDVVEARDHDEAEAVFFRRQLGEGSAEKARIEPARA